MNKPASKVLELTTECLGLSGVPTAFDPVGCRKPDSDRQFRRNGRTNGLEDFKRITHSPFGNAAVRVSSEIRDRRKELVKQNSMRHVELDQVETDTRGAERLCNEFCLHAQKILRTHFAWRLPAFQTWHGRRGHHLPGSLGRCQRAPVKPRRPR